MDLDDDELEATLKGNKRNYIFAKSREPSPILKYVEEEVITKGGIRTVYQIYICFYNNGQWIKIYETFMEVNARKALKHLKEISDVYLHKLYTYEEKYCPMFEYADQIYKTTFVCFNQSCICGDNIPGNTHYGELSPDGVKHDYALSTIFFYEPGMCLVKGNQLFLDGELLLNSHELYTLCHEIDQNMGLLDSSADKLIKHIANNYPNAKSYTCNGYTSYGIRTRYKEEK